MASFFCLGGDRDHGHHHTPSKQEEDQEINNNHNPHQRNLFLYRSNEHEISSKGFEIWPQQYHHQQQQNTNFMSFETRTTASAAAAAAAATPPSRATRHYSFNINDVVAVSPSDEPALGLITMNMMRAQGGGGGGGLGSGGSSSGGGAGMNCQDCGNQAKKDCSHLRCRTCCKSRGFHCQTHVKSTWVPASKRRERQQQLAALQQLQTQQQQQQQQQEHQQFRLENTKRQRDHRSSAAATTRNLPTTTTSGLELGGAFPAEVNSQAVFRCVRVSAMDDADEHFAYQTAVNIGGHVFKGILYDQGPDGHFTTAGGGEGSSGHGRGGDPTQELNLIASATTATTNNNQSLSLLDPSLVYPTPINAFMAGTQFFPPPRS